MSIRRFIIDIPAEGLENVESQDLLDHLENSLTRGVELSNGDIVYINYDVANITESSIASDVFVTDARTRHCENSDNEIEIDEPASMSEGVDGVWIQAWVFLPGVGSQYVDLEDNDDEPCGIPF